MGLGMGVCQGLAVVMGGDHVGNLMFITLWFIHRRAHQGVYQELGRQGWKRREQLRRRRHRHQHRQ